MNSEFEIRLNLLLFLSYPNANPYYLYEDG